MMHQWRTVRAWDMVDEGVQLVELCDARRRTAVDERFTVASDPAPLPEQCPRGKRMNQEVQDKPQLQAGDRIRIRDNRIDEYDAIDGSSIRHSRLDDVATLISFRSMAGWFEDATLEKWEVEFDNLPGRYVINVWNTEKQD